MNVIAKLAWSGFLPLALLAGTGLDTAAQKIDPGSYQKVIEENLDLRRDQDRLGREIGDLRRQNATLVLDVRDLERKRDQLTALMAQLKTPDETKNEMGRLQAENLVLVREIERLRQALSAIRVMPTNTPVVAVPTPAPGSDLFRKVEQENAGLRQELMAVRGAMQAETATREGLKLRVSELEVEVRKLSGDVAREGQAAERSGKVADAFRKALEKLARHAYQQERDIRELKEKAATVVVAKGKAAGAAASKPSENGVRDRTVIALFDEAEKALQTGKAGEAEKLYLEALRRDASNPRVHYNLGVLYDDYLKESRKALRYYRKYLELSPAAPDAAAVRAWIYDLESE